MKKIFATISAIVILIAVGFLFTGRLSVPVSKLHYKKINILNKDQIVSKVELNPEWTFPTRLSEAPEGIERWRKVILLSQTDYLKFLSYREGSNLYGRTVLTQEQIDQQKDYVTDRFRENSYDLKILRLYVVLDTEARTCHLIVPVIGPQGEYYTSFEWIRGEWHLVPGAKEIGWETTNGKEIIRAIEAEELKYVPVKDFDRLMRRLSATYLNS
jgi:hypothetical protein